MAIAFTFLPMLFTRYYAAFSSGAAATFSPCYYFSRYARLFCFTLLFLHAACWRYYAAYGCLRHAMLMIRATISIAAMFAALIFTDAAAYAIADAIDVTCRVTLHIAA